MISLLLPVESFSPADEWMYEQYLSLPISWRQMCAGFVENKSCHGHPPPTRWPVLLLARALGIKTRRGLSHLSSFFHLALGALAFCMGGPWAALLALSAPLGLLLGRRALLDTASAATVLLMFAVRYNSVLLPCAIALALATKETALLYLPALFLLVGFSWSWPLAGALFAVLGLLVCGLAFLRTGKIILTTPAAHGYGARFMSGPPWRGLVDLMILSPISTLLGMGWVPALALLNHGSLRGGQNARPLLAADILLRIAAVQILPWWGCLGVTALDLWTFWKLRNVYDPVTANLTKALQMAP